jgi:hypothetical protein
MADNNRKYYFDWLDLHFVLLYLIYACYNQSKHRTTNVTQIGFHKEKLPRHLYHCFGAVMLLEN